MEVADLLESHHALRVDEARLLEDAAGADQMMQGQGEVRDVEIISAESPGSRAQQVMALANARNSIDLRAMSNEPLTDISRSILLTKDIDPIYQNEHTLKVEAALPACKADFFMTQGSGEFTVNQDTIPVP